MRATTNRVTMTDCCDHPGNDDVFDVDVARRTARRYLRRGLLAHERRLLAPVLARGVDGAHVLEIGGGTGQLGLALLDAGAAHATTVDLSPHYDGPARDLAAHVGHAGHVTRIHADATAPDTPLPTADVVLLHRVVCCTDRWRELLDAATSTGATGLALSLPAAGPLPRTITTLDNTLHALRGHTFRMRHHSPTTLITHLTTTGLTPTADTTRLYWRTLHLTR